jgi:hypothetical protein
MRALVGTAVVTDTGTAVIAIIMGGADGAVVGAIVGVDSTRAVVAVLGDPMTGKIVVGSRMTIDDVVVVGCGAVAATTSSVGAGELFLGGTVAVIISTLVEKIELGNHRCCFLRMTMDIR